ncbi:hypothetical protein PC121_g22821 [Phytophthora cactorum]|nr:hypothetical protein PC120_g21498 [Phytophthora cactorum]KAG3043001.1 hypothetical protein PC121_g22821 [Phytophthora cactorum]KAG4043031.1 hypothetical protein PC123_g21496 [Phytophthora cactorum]
MTAAQTNITSVGTLAGLTIDGNLTFSGVSRSITGLNSLSASTITGSLSTAAQTAITSLGTLTGLTIGGSLTFTGASRTITGLSSVSATNITASRSITGLASLTATDLISTENTQCNTISGTTLTYPMYSDSFSLTLRNSSLVSSSYCGIALHNDTGSTSNTTPSAAIISRRTSTTAYAGSNIEFMTRDDTLQATSLVKHMTIAGDGKVSIGSTGDKDFNILTAANADFRFGTLLGNRNCITMSWTYVSSNSTSNRLSFDTYGSTNTLVLTAGDRVCVGGAAPTSKFHVVGDSGILYGSWERVAEFGNSNATPMKAGLIIYGEPGGPNTNGVAFGTYTNDPLWFMVNGSTAMKLTPSKRLSVDKTAGAEATIHSGGDVWADGLFHIKQNVDGKAVYRTNWSQANYLAMGTDATVGAMRLGTCDASFNWVSYAPCRGGSYTNASDRRIKQDIFDIPYGLAEVLQMQPRKFAMRNDQSLHVGFIAQEMLKIIPESISGDESADDDMNDQGEPINPMGIDLASLTAVLCKAIQEQQQQIDELRAIISE